MTTTITTTITCDHCERALKPNGVGATVHVSGHSSSDYSVKFDLCHTCLPLFAEFMGLRPNGDEER